MQKAIIRPPWDEYFMDIAHAVKARSNCIKRRVGAVIVKDNRIISTGYNGTPRKIKNCNEGGCERCNSNTPSGKDLDKCICSHAEENAITQAALHGVRLEGAQVYTTFTPCTACTKLILGSGILKVIAAENYPDKRGMALLKEAKVEFEFLDTMRQKSFKEF